MPLEFRDIQVAPTQDVLGGVGAHFRGGPLWPDFRRQTLARHCHGRRPVPIDSPPTPFEVPVDSLASGVWCGPIVGHFGHMIADFGMRIAASMHGLPTTPLIFSLKPHDSDPPPFFHRMLAHWGADPSLAVFVRRPVLVRELAVYPQAERRPDGGPSSEHLDLLDELTRGPAEQAIGTLYVSRAGSVIGGVAGEAQIEAAFRRLGCTVSGLRRSGSTNSCAPTAPPGGWSSAKARRFTPCSCSDVWTAR